MSVYKSRRREAALKFTTEAKELRILTMTYVKRFPTSYRWITTNNLLEIVNNIYSDCARASGIDISTDQNDYDLRRRYLQRAAGNLSALGVEISFCYDLLIKGNNFFKSKKELNNAFFKWTSAVRRTQEQIGRILEEDEQKFNLYKEHPEMLTEKNKPTEGLVQTPGEGKSVKRGKHFS